MGRFQFCGEMSKGEGQCGGPETLDALRLFLRSCDERFLGSKACVFRLVDGESTSPTLADIVELNPVHRKSGPMSCLNRDANRGALLERSLKQAAGSQQTAFLEPRRIWPFHERSTLSIVPFS